jgi:hypothetical protein
MILVRWGLPLLLAACQAQATVIPVSDLTDTDDPIDTGDTGTGPQDLDRDGFFADEDCDDQDPQTFPGAEERCDLIDQDCDGTPVDIGSCPCDEVRVAGSVLLVACGEAASWARAADTCADAGLTLAIVRDEATNDVLQAFAQEIRLSPPWIGASDSQREGSWRWIDGSAVSWENWGSGEPNDFGQGEDCVQFYPWDGTWNDARCDVRLPFVCTWSEP